MQDNKWMILMAGIIVVLFIIFPVTDVTKKTESIKKEEVSKPQLSLVGQVEAVGRVVMPSYPFGGLLIITILSYLVVFPIMKYVRKYVEYKMMNYLVRR